MEAFEQEVLDQAPLKPLIFWRYIDDTFLLWKHGQEALDKFVNYLNNVYDSIKLTLQQEWERKLSFLDILITRQADGTLGKSVYRKMT